MSPYTSQFPLGHSWSPGVGMKGVDGWSPAVKSQHLNKKMKTSIDHFSVFTFLGLANVSAVHVVIVLAALVVPHAWVLGREDLDAVLRTGSVRLSGSPLPVLRV